MPAGHTFATAIWWLASTGITGGAGGSLYEPGQPVTRQAMAAFLYRGNLVQLIDVPTADRCEFLDPAHCLLVFPSNHFTVADPTTDTGLRVNFDPASLRHAVVHTSAHTRLRSARRALIKRPRPILVDTPPHAFRAAGSWSGRRRRGPARSHVRLTCYRSVRSD